jgi:hypothetical protein
MTHKIQKNQITSGPKRLRDVGPEHSEAIKTMLHHVVEPYTAIMDIYMLARMFKIFKDGTTPENIIVYAGAEHVINIDRISPPKKM